MPQMSVRPFDCIMVYTLDSLEFQYVCEIADFRDVFKLYA